MAVSSREREGRRKLGSNVLTYLDKLGEKTNDLSLRCFQIRILVALLSNCFSKVY